MTDDLLARADAWRNDGHKKLCGGRSYSCACGFDLRQEQLIEDLAAALREARTAQIIACMEAESRGHKRGFSDGYKAAEQRAERAEAERDALAALLREARAMWVEDCSTTGRAIDAFLRGEGEGR